MIVPRPRDAETDYEESAEEATKQGYRNGKCYDTYEAIMMHDALQMLRFSYCDQQLPVQLFLFIGFIACQIVSFPFKHDIFEG